MNRVFKMKLWLLAGLLFLPFWPALPQAPSMSGRVLDADSRRPIANVNIVVLGTRYGTTTDREGRFELPRSLQPTDTLVFSHIGYHPYRCSVQDLAGMEAVLLRVRVLPFPGLEVEAQKDSPVSREIPASVTLLPVETVLAEASTDLGDYLQRNASVKIDETVAGQKWLSVRGGNPDEVRIVYDGIPLNTSGSNAFDLAQIDLANLERVELIKGSNTVLFGDGAFAGVLNIVPQKRARYTIRTVARLGTYRAREIALNMFQSRGALTAGYTFSRRNAERRFGSNQEAVFNASQFHTLWTRYAGRRHQVQARWLYYGSAFDQESALMQQDNRNHVLALNYEGRVRLLRHVKASLIYKALTGEKSWQQASRRLRGEEENRDHSLALRFETQQNFAGVKLTLVYEHLRNGFDADLQQYSETRPDPILDQQRLQRIQDGLMWVLKNRLDLEHRGFRFIDWDLSFRIDWVSMSRDIRSLSGESERRLQAELGLRSYLTYKFGMRAMGEVAGFRYNAMVANGANVKLPTLLQLFHWDVQPLMEFRNRPLQPERNIGTEFSLQVERAIAGAPWYFPINGLQAEFALFRNSYLEKITEMANIVPLPTPFNTTLAWTRGLESRLSLRFLEDRLEWNGAVLLLDISDPRVFRFKPKQKITSDLWLRLREWQFNAHVFAEGDQFAMVPAYGEVFSQTLPGRWDIDLALQKRWHWRELRGFVNLAIRNLRNSGRNALSGFYLQDRRWYISIGVEW